MVRRTTVNGSGGTGRAAGGIPGPAPREIPRRTRYLAELDVRGPRCSNAGGADGTDQPATGVCPAPGPPRQQWTRAATPRQTRPSEVGAGDGRAPARSAAWRRRVSTSGSPDTRTARHGARLDDPGRRGVKAPGRVAGPRWGAASWRRVDHGNHARGVGPRRHRSPVDGPARQAGEMTRQPLWPPNPKELDRIGPVPRPAARHHVEVDLRSGCS